MSDRPTPETDAALAGGMTAAETHAMLQRLERQRDELLEWKASALEVESRWNCQEVGRLLGLTIGQAVHPSIEPGIRKLLADRERLASALQKACAYPVCGDWLEEAQQALESLK